MNGKINVRLGSANPEVFKVWGATLRVGGNATYFKKQHCIGRAEKDL